MLGVNHMNKQEIVDFLYETNKSAFEPYFKQSASISPEPKAVGKIVLSNICEMDCRFCAYRKDNNIDRFILSMSDTEKLCDLAIKLSLGEVILESGVLADETYPLLRQLIHGIKSQKSLNFILEPGSESIIRHPSLLNSFTKVFIDYQPANKSFIAELASFDRGDELRAVLSKYKSLDIYTNYVVDLPGQSFEDMAEDIIRLCDSDLKGIKISPFLPRKGTDYAIFSVACLLTTLKFISLVRLRRRDWDIYIDSSIRHLEYDDSLKQALTVGSNLMLIDLSLSMADNVRPLELSLLDEGMN